MTATDELRAELTKRGVEWSGKESTDVGNMTEWECGKTKAVAMEEDDGTLGLGATYLTPAQAIAATLGESITDIEKAALECRIDELCAEVEQGKAEFKKMDVWHSQELKAAMDENAKLREQVDYMTPLALYAASERERDRMRELGIEVD